jgi:hypothetical protein
MPNYFVHATLLNLRSTPILDADGGNIITRLKSHEIIDVLDNSNHDWFKISCINRRPAIDGYAASRYLKPVDTLRPDNISFLQPVHLKQNDHARRNYHGAWQYPLSELTMPRVDVAFDITQKISAMHKIISYLQVSQSARYQRDIHTYCNIYAYDYCYLAGVFLPRVWWRNKALIRLKEGQAVEPLYDVTVDEVRANDLFTWLEEWGEDYKWTRTYDLNELQSKVDLGGVGVICAQNINPSASGHICCVVPESGDKIATREGGKVVCPLLSQAGAINLPYYNNNKWWVRLSSRFRHIGFWFCSP